METLRRVWCRWSNSHKGGAHGRLSLAFAMLVSIAATPFGMSRAFAQDVLWYNEGTGEMQVWKTGWPGEIRERATVLYPNGSVAYIGPPYVIVGVGDFGNDGFDDIVWHHEWTGETQIWTMHEHQLLDRQSVLSEDGTVMFVGPPWRIVTVTDRKIIWHNESTNETQIWFMNGARVIRRANVVGEDHRTAVVGDPFRIVGSGHILGSEIDSSRWCPPPPPCIPNWLALDPSASCSFGAPCTMLDVLVWHNAATGEVQLWLMQDENVVARRTILSESGTPALETGEWGIAAVSWPGILWHNAASQETQLWFLRGSQISERKTFTDEAGQAIFVGSPWRIAGYGPFARHSEPR